ncbi:DUF1275 domain-containing protein [Rhodococcus sp. BP-252]|nr:MULTISPECIES: YoaK family protein [unclassified Rhodococcus (in: high G+C Gram-positive bacteria)]MBY6412856.1 DUF1275 domain-containing protein [Rhodococcus sp. BP-320]MBY6417607.1 DUF1275 domain-containing protein [Rhodococcus sp. BP-321]MBY6423459.1 DUF1275 domain-containing protein [Rhodococcus sp. BP-324]MBY6427631.1 DUF1275 domain-containing protein [Rhodococcus sp. BP-323]MBY6432795.1 DUF1275 domain-containing protein [Rhodococcus sp. BP-322]MBY6441589.1 DUF1275 domain-containing pr
MMMMLTFVAGLVDAVGYLGLDHIFAGNMTGNIVILGLGAAGADELPVLGPLLALVSFVGGACVTGFWLRAGGGMWNRWVTVQLSVGVLLLGSTAALLWIFDESTTGPEKVFAACAIAAQMGSQACIARYLAVKEMTTVVVTSTLTALAGESVHGKHGPRILNRRSGAIFMVFGGAVIGALLLRVHVSIPIALSAVMTGVVVLVGSRRWSRAPRQLG